MLDTHLLLALDKNQQLGISWSFGVGTGAGGGGGTISGQVLEAGSASAHLPRLPSGGWLLAVFVSFVPTCQLDPGGGERLQA